MLGHAVKYVQYAQNTNVIPVNPVSVETNVKNWEFINF